jgi:hypothetical protein
MNKILVVNQDEKPSSKSRRKNYGVERTISSRKQLILCNK